MARLGLSGAGPGPTGTTGGAAGVALPGSPGANPMGATTTGSQSSYTNQDGSFNINGAASTTTDPGIITGTDVYGLTPTQEKWTFYQGEDPSLVGETQKSISANVRLAHGNPDDNVIPPPSWANALDLMKYFNKIATSPSATDRATWSNVQKQLMAIDKTYAAQAIVGYWTPVDAPALIKAFQGYQQTAGSDGAGQPITFSEYLNQASGQSAADGLAGGGASGTGSSAPILADPDTLTRYAQMAAKNALGRALTPTELQQFVSEFHSQQIQSYTDAAGHNGLSAVKDDPRSSAIGFVTTSNPQEFQTHQTSGYTDAFLNMFLPQGSSAPNVSVDPQAVGY